jgi:hypothetical protein
VCFLAVLVLVACGPRQTPVTAGSAVAFTDEGATQMSGYDGREPKVEIRKSGDRWLVTAFQGQQQTAGYLIRIEKITVGGTILRVRARFTAPAADAVLAQVITSPAHTVGIAFGADLVILFDQDDHERARAQP